MRLFFILILSSVNCFAAGKGHGTVSDLMWPAVNFIVLFGFLFHKMKSPINESYMTLSEDIKNKINSAKNAEEKAIDFLNSQKTAQANTENEIIKLQQDHELNLSNQRKVLESEYDQKTKKLYSDFENKLIGERKKIESKISSNLLESIINKTSNTISGNPENKDKAMRKFLQ